MKSTIILNWNDRGCELKDIYRYFIFGTWKLHAGDKGFVICIPSIGVKCNLGYYFDTLNNILK